jgi:hypothetical protein
MGENVICKNAGNRPHEFFAISVAFCFRYARVACLKIAHRDRGDIFEFHFYNDIVRDVIGAQDKKSERIFVVF